MLKAHGLRRTAGRLRVLRALKSARKPLPHADILQRLGKPPMDRVSLYRALDAFVEAGLVHRVLVDERTCVFEFADRCGPHQCHPHFYCRACRDITCLTDTELPMAKGLPRGYIVERQKVSIDGLCPRCHSL